MRKKCSNCDLVNGAEDVSCRRCGKTLGMQQTITAPRLRGKEIVKEIKLKADDDVEFEQPKKLIDAGVKAGAICGTLSFFVMVLLNLGLASTHNFLLPAFVELGLALTFTIGLHLKSRVCAGLLLALYTIGKLVLLVQGQTAFVGLFLAFIFVRSLYQGWQGTIQYHQIKTRKMQHAQA